jgi:hypothetical protein
VEVLRLLGHGHDALAGAVLGGGNTPSQYPLAFSLPHAPTGLGGEQHRSGKEGGEERGKEEGKGEGWPEIERIIKQGRIQK